MTLDEYWADSQNIAPTGTTRGGFIVRSDAGRGVKVLLTTEQTEKLSPGQHKKLAALNGELVRAVNGVLRDSGL